VLTAADMRPYHSRHRKLACDAISLSSELPANCHDEAIARVWDHWVGRGTFWQDPLYAYLLAAVYATLGSGERIVYVLQATAGAACAVLVYAIGLRLFGPAAATAAGLLAALYGPLIFFETLRLRETAITLAGLATVHYALRAVDSGERRLAGIAGIWAGASVLLKASVVPFVAASAPLLVWLSRGNHTERAAPAARRRAWALAAVFVAGVGLAVAPLVARNVAVGIAPLSVAGTGPLNFLNGNAVDHSPDSGSAVSAHALRILTRTGGTARPVVRETIATHDSAVAWLATLAEKLWVFWQPYEIPNNANFQYFRLQAPWLAAVPIDFRLIAPLALVGIVLGLFRTRAALVPIAYIAAGIAVCVVFYNLGRFRLPAAVAMMPFAGYALVWPIRAAGERRYVAAVAAVVMILATAWMIGDGEAGGVSRLRIADYGVHNEITVNLAARRAAEGDVGGALTLVRRQLETEPPALEAIEPGPGPTRISRYLSAVAGTFAPLHEAAAALSARAGNDVDARVDEHRASVLRALARPYEQSEGL
jgi:hypothetical protein